MKFRKKPVEIEAFPVSDALVYAKGEWNGMPGWLTDAYEKGNVLFLGDSVEILTREGRMVGDEDDWIIRGVHGELYPIKPDIFQETYVPVTGSGLEPDALKNFHQTQEYEGAYLDEADPEPELPKPTNLYVYRVDQVIGNYDGDTVDVVVDLGLRVYTAMRIRLYGIDTPEVRGEEREDGILLKEYVTHRMESADDILVRTYQDKTEKFGRWLGVLFVDGVNLNKELLEEFPGTVREYMREEPWPEIGEVE